MDLTQNKLTKSEWEGIELPVSASEKSILAIIQEGAEDVMIRKNNNDSMISSIKITYTPEIESYLYKTYFQKPLLKMIQSYAKDVVVLSDAANGIISELKKPPNSKDTIRLKNMESTINTKKSVMVEYTLLDLCKNTLVSIHSRKTDYMVPIYTLHHILTTTIPFINKHLVHFIRTLIDWVRGSFPNLVRDMVHHAPDILEKNALILKYADITLFEHQKRLFQIFGPKSNRETPKLVLYIAPTGTGKTLSPLGLSQNHRVIFVCMARHVGLALARSAISMEKKVAFAFGCETAADIRLHYFSAIDYTRNWKSGSIRKVDNSVGYKVELMICDVKSYKIAMLYMLAFNQEKDVITFWDEPTITMDYPSHALHEIIHENWRENRVSKIVLSCATLPCESEISDTIADFRARFDNSEIHTISTHDCKKTISLLNKSGLCVLPHNLFADHRELLQCAEHCSRTKSLLRYFDLSEMIRFLEYVHSKDMIQEPYTISSYFASMEDIDMNRLKLYYLEALVRISEGDWAQIYQHMTSTQPPFFEKRTAPVDRLRKIRSEEPVRTPLTISGTALTRIQSVQILEKSAPVVAREQPVAQVPVENPFSGILITTEDAHTLTDGPSIYLAENIENVGKFYIAQTKIPARVLDSVMEKIEYNNAINKKIDDLEKKVEEKEAKTKEVDSTAKNASKRASSGKETNSAGSKEVREFVEQINELRNQILMSNIDSVYIPNTTQHQNIWVHGDKVNNAFVPNIDDESIRIIMALDVTSQQKLLLLLGIGMFVNQPNIQYMEIMKKLASAQKLFLIIAASDYIYGTNYPFCHGFIGKDIANMTQQKTIQALGRIGRGNIQQNYTVRFRDDTIIRQLFLPMERNVEGEVMSRLMSGSAEWAEANIIEKDIDETPVIDVLPNRYARYQISCS